MDEDIKRLLWWIAGGTAVAYLVDPVIGHTFIIMVVFCSSPWWLFSRFLPWFTRTVWPRINGWYLTGVILVSLPALSAWTTWYEGLNFWWHLLVSYGKGLAVLILLALCALLLLKLLELFAPIFERITKPQYESDEKFEKAAFMVKAGLETFSPDDPVVEKLWREEKKREYEEHRKRKEQEQSDTND